MRIYFYYRDLIRFRERGDPAVLLKSINPLEANYADAACGLHVRFRLGGARFPPLIYYKVFTHRPVTDMCSFSPKDYIAAAAAKLKPKERHNKPKNGVERTEDMSGWYKRVENNGWRPISQHILVDVDTVTQQVRPLTAVCLSRK